MNTHIVQFVHKNRKNRTGPLRAVVIAQVRPENPNEVGIGWAMARRQNGNQIDQFDRDSGIRIASGRAAHLTASDRSLSKNTAPHSLKKEIESITKRATHYFRDKKVIPITKFHEPNSVTA